MNEDFLARPLRWFLSVLGALTAACLAVEWVCGRVLHLGYPYNWPLMPPATRYYDFSLYRARFDFFHSAKFFAFDGPGYLYPAPVAALHRLLYLLLGGMWTFLALLLATWAFASFLLWGALVRRGMQRGNATVLVAIAALCSYPFWFEFEQANVEWILCLLVGCGVMALLRGRGFTAAACFGIAGSMKIYPLVLVGLLLSRRQYKQAAAAFVVCGVSTMVGLWLVCPDLATSWHGTQVGLETFRQWYVLRYEQVGFDHSLVGLGKALSLVVLSGPLAPQGLALLVNLYMVVAAFAGVVLYFDRIRKLPVINQVLCVVAATILLPPVSYDYTLLHLYLPWALLVMVALERRECKGMMAGMVCFAILFAPERELIWGGRSYGGQVKALALVVLFGIGLVGKFESRFDGEAVAAT